MSDLLRRLFTETWPAKAAKSAIEALMLPGQIAGGELATQPSAPGMWSDVDEARSQATQQGIGNRATDLAGLLMGGSYAAPAQRNAVGSGIRAYHGSPHDFDRFDLSKIGTGEGAQAYGHGLYFADNPTVAETYRSKLAAIHGTGKPQVDGRPLDWDNPIETAAFELMRHNGDRQAAAEFFERTFSKSSPVAGILRSGEPLPSVKPAGRMYEVNINARPEQFLDWDRPLAQTPEVMAKLGPIGFGPNMTGQDIYQRLVGSARPGSGGGMNSAGVRLSDMPPVEVSGRMNATGIPGIKYLDQGSRGAGEGSRNYVVFDDKLIDILRKYGLAGAAGPLGALLMGGGGDAQAQPTAP